MFQLYNNIFVILMLEFIDCIHNTQPSDYFSVEFLNNPLFEILPEGYDVCYMVKRTDDYLGGYFYLYDSTRPMNIYDSDYVLGVVEFYIDLEEDELNIPMLRTNSDLDGFDMTRGGIGTYLLLCLIIAHLTLLGSKASSELICVTPFIIILESFSNLFNC